MNDTVDYYQKLSAAYGDSTQDFARLFLVRDESLRWRRLYHRFLRRLGAIVDWVEKAARRMRFNPNRGAQAQQPRASDN